MSNFTNGLGWEKLPFATRNNDTRLVTRKTKDAVTAFSEGAQDLLMSLFTGADMLAAHAKRKTIRPADMKLVSAICKSGGLPL